MRKITVYRTEAEKHTRLQEVYSGEMEKEIINENDEYVENNVVNVYASQVYQNILGFGGAFTEASGYCFSRLKEEQQDLVARLYFDKEDGIGYSFGRLHMNSCDFSLDNYACCEQESDILDGFNIDRDRQYILPMIRKCQTYGNIQFLMAPWSPPAWMKDNKEMNHGGHLLPEYRKLWAEYYVRFMKAYKEEGVCIAYTSVQNEPYAVQTWDSCIFTAEEERDFVRQYLGPTLEQSEFKDVKILVWDHNKERILEHVEPIFTDKEASKYIWGTAFHWYSGDHFEALDLMRRNWPDKQLVMTECCVDLTCPSELVAAERYAHEIIGDFVNGTTAFIDWNLLLDENGGPNHVGNFCDAPIRMNTADGEVSIHLSYYYIGHFSRFLPEGSMRIASTGYCSEMEHIAFKRPDGSIVIELLNRTNENLPVIIRMDGCWKSMEIPAHSLSTVVVQ